MAASRGKLFSQSAKAHRLIFYRKNLSTQQQLVNSTLAEIIIKNMELVAEIHLLEDAKKDKKILYKSIFLENEKREKDISMLSDKELENLAKNLPSDINKYEKKLANLSDDKKFQALKKIDIWKEKLQKVRNERRKRRNNIV